MGRMATMRVVYCAAAVVLCGTAVLFWIFAEKNSHTPKIPSAIVQQLAFTPHLPKRLPGDYSVIRNSFATDEGALIFQAVDSTGRKLTFTEQQKPQKPNFFSDFYQLQMGGAETLSHTPYPSTLGKARDGQSTLLSIVTPDTWLLITSSFTLDKAAALEVAQNIQHS